MVSAPEIQNGRLHRFSSKLVAFEHLAPPSAQPTKNILLWIGGLGDGLSTVSYPNLLSQRLPAGWSLAQVILRSSYDGWGTRTLQKDVKEIDKCVEYFRRLGAGLEKIVVMGHSTGCQDAMEYISGDGREGRAKIDGVILQAPVSDREARFCEEAEHSNEEFDFIVKVAREWVGDGRGDDVLPRKVAEPFYGSTPVTAYRCLSLLSPDCDGDDDYFSSDLSDERLACSFGRFGRETPLLILFSGSDQHVPSSIDKKALVDRWSNVVNNSGGIVDEEHGGVVSGAHHNLEEDDDEVFQDLSRRVAGFLSKLDDGF